MQQSHRNGVPLQDQLLGSPHLLLLHLPADRLLGLVGQLTARRQARIPDHLLNPTEKTEKAETKTVKQKKADASSIVCFFGAVHVL